MKSVKSKGEISKKYEEYFKKHEKKILEDFYTFLRFKSISADPAHRQDIRKCATWVASFLQGAGCKVQTWDTPVNPVIFASHEAKAPNRPTLLIYHHYDVQPVDPLELWKHPPFEPTLIGNEVYARGACDNKGQCLYGMYGVKAFLEIGKKEDLNIKVIIEGEEEVGSTGFFKVLEEKKAHLKADYVAIIDAGIPSLEQPAVTLGFRGIITFDVECSGSNVDLHSGQLGGIAYNPLRALVEVLAKVWDKEGKVTIDHFYEGIIEQNAKELMPIDINPLIKNFDLKALHHEKGYTSLESNWTRPTFEINGLFGGYSGAGFKTVIPAKAGCKISCRLVVGQDPLKVGEYVQKFFQKNIEKGFTLKVELHHGGEAYRASSQGAFAKMTKRAYEDVMGIETGFILAGGTLPIATKLSEVSGGETIGMGYGFDDDYVHAPNEHFGIDRLKYGLMTLGSLLELLAGVDQ
jgi:acetylornithine deacetylase/succinyl-diaminopimelate desuccinylase-like protein